MSSKKQFFMKNGKYIKINLKPINLTINNG